MRRRRPTDHAEAVARVHEFRAQVISGRYRRPPERPPLTSADVAEVEMVSSERRSFAVIPAECMEAWGRENRW